MKKILNYNINFTDRIDTLVKFEDMPDWTFFYDVHSDGVHLALKTDGNRCYDFDTRMFFSVIDLEWEYYLAFVRFSVTPKVSCFNDKNSCSDINVKLPEHDILGHVSNGELFLCSFDDRKSYHLCFTDWDLGIFDLVDQKIHTMRESLEDGPTKFQAEYDNVIRCDNVKIEVFRNDPQLKEDQKMEDDEK